MILADTSVWIDYLRHGDTQLAGFLNAGQVLIHPLVIGELAVGNLRNRDQILGNLIELPQVITATDAEVMRFIADHALFGIGIGFNDAHLLAAVRLSPGNLLWTHDKRLHAASVRLGLAASPTH